LLSAKKPGDPIGAMAKTMHAIFLDSPPQFSHSLTQLYGITADYFIDTRGSGDLVSLDARLEVIQINHNDEVPDSESESILSICSDLLDEAIKLFGEDSKETIRIEYNCLRAMLILRSWYGFEDLCERHIRRIGTGNEVSWDSWDSWDLDSVAWALLHFYDFYQNADDTGSSIRCLQECICMLDYLHERGGTSWGCGTRAAECRMELIDVLIESGRLQEASEVRMDLVRSGYLKEVMDSDFERNSFET
ncbi:hypothetical protein LZ30DRAFT_596733, partial [Colletotrichum cereale]